MLNQIKRITTNAGINGIELYFDGKPGAAILERLKAAFFRWHNVKKCWYAKANATTEAIAQELNGGELSEGVEHAATSERKQNAVSVPPLWERCDVSTIPEHNRHADTKTICAECRTHLKARFPEMKFSIRKTSHNSIDADIISGPYKRERVMTDRFGNPDPWGHWENSDELEAVLKYCEAFLQSYNYDNSDTMTDYFDVNFYGRFTIASKYEQIEQTAEIVADCTDFAKKKAAFEIAEEQRRAAESEAREKELQKEREEAEAAAIVRSAQISEIESHVKTVDLEESEAFAVLGLVQDVGKSARLDEVEAHDNKAALDGSRIYQDIIITRKIEFTDTRIFANFCNLFLYRFEFLAGFGGWAVEDCRIESDADLRRLNRKQRETVKSFGIKGIAVYLDGVFQFAIDPEGYDYARYILFPVSVFDDETNIQSAAEYLADRRKETQNLPRFYFPETIAEQLEKSNLQAGEEITMLKVHEWLVMAQTTRGRVIDFQPIKWAQYNDAAKISLIPKGKRNISTDYIHAGQAVVIYRGELPPIPDSLLYSDETHYPGAGATIKRVNYAGSGSDEFIIKAIEYYKTLGYTPIIDLIQR